MSAPEGTRITIRRPDDFHHHFRDGLKTASIVAHAEKRFARCLAMPNLSPPVTTTKQAEAYYEHIKSSGTEMDLVMTLYLTDRTTPDEVRNAWNSTKAPIKAVKFYPAGATTNSEFGVTDVTLCYPAIRTMAELGMILCIHSEVSTPGVDIFDREAVFIEQVMKPLVAAIPNIQIVMEHISTDTAVQYVQSAPNNVAASITCHHLLYNRNALLVGGIKPHFYCLPILKREKHREALIAAATSGNKKFFLGTDSAPHTRMMKETGCGCAGVFTAHAALELYAEAFDRMNKLEHFEPFCSHFGADHYGLPRNEGTITLVKKEWTVPRVLDLGGKDLQPLRAGETVAWSIVDA